MLGKYSVARCSSNPHIMLNVEEPLIYWCLCLLYWASAGADVWYSTTTGGLWKPGGMCSMEQPENKSCNVPHAFNNIDSEIWCLRPVRFTCLWEDCHGVMSMRGFIFSLEVSTPNRLRNRTTEGLLLLRGRV